MSNAEEIIHSNEFQSVSTQLAETGRFLAERGWAPATSANYSSRLTETSLVAISRSGVDKYKMNAQDFLAITLASNETSPGFSVIIRHTPAAESVRPSAETLIHAAIYQARPEARAVLHAHSPNNTRLSLRFLSQGHLKFKGYEMQKGLEGQTHHEDIVRVPILANSQDMKSFSVQVFDLLREERDVVGFLIAGHGLYTWGASVASARRHIETFEFLFSCHALELMGV